MTDMAPKRAAIAAKIKTIWNNMMMQGTITVHHIPMLTMMKLNAQTKITVMI